MIRLDVLRKLSPVENKSRPANESRSDYDLETMFSKKGNRIITPHKPPVNENFKVNS